MSFRCVILSLIILLNIPGSLGEEITCSPQTICALQESTVTLTCFYSNTIKPQQSFWFSPKQKAKWRNEGDPEDLDLDSDYAGRVYNETIRDSSSRSAILTIRDLRERDSGEYHLILITEKGEKYLSSAAVTLTVSDLQVRMTSDSEKQTLNCSTSCSLTSNYYNWYKNSQYVQQTNGSQLYLYNRADSGSYSCSVRSNVEIRSNTVCVSDENCWSVIYSDRRVCVLEGSSVDFPCTYSYPSNLTVNKTFWYYFQSKVEPTDLSKEETFAGRVEFVGNKERNCTLRMKNLTKTDSGQYRFRFITDTKGGKLSGNPGVILTVTDLQVKVSPSTSSEGQTVTLTCSSTCTLPNNPTYIWYKNGQPVTNKPTRYNQLYLDSASSEDLLQYSCALAGSEISVLTLITVGVSVSLALILITGWMCMCCVIKRKRRTERNNDVQAPNPGNDTYAALNLSTMSSDYDTLTHLKCSSSDTYTSLNPATMTSDYDTLRNVTGSRVL